MKSISKEKEKNIKIEVLLEKRVGKKKIPILKIYTPNHNTSKAKQT